MRTTTRDALLPLLLLAFVAGCGGNTLRSSDDGMPSDATGGAGGSAERGEQPSRPIEVRERRLALGDSHSCLTRGDARLLCWGDNYQGQLGVGTAGHGKQGDERRVPTLVPSFGAVLRASASRHHTCAVTAEHQLACWGFNGEGELGMGHASGLEEDSADTSPRLVPKLDDVMDVAAGKGFTCVLHAEGSVSCWGTNYAGQLGAGFASLEDSHQPETVLGITDATAINAGDGHACALESGKVLCWGIGDELGTGVDLECSTEPIGVLGLGPTRSIRAGAIDSCALGPSGTARCWGQAGSGQLGFDPGQDWQMSLLPIAAPLDQIDDVAVGLGHICALRLDGSVWCWGANQSGQLGRGDVSKPDSKPLKVSLPGAALEVAAGGYHSCARLADSRTFCWGSNASGQIGNGAESEQETKPVEIAAP